MTVCARPVVEVVADLKARAIRALTRMYLPQERLFCFRLRRVPGQQQLEVEGISARYTAIVLIGLADEGAEAAQAVLGTHSADEVCERLCEYVRDTEDVGSAALALWAARRIGHSGWKGVWEQLQAMAPQRCSCPTVELAWSLTSLVLPGQKVVGDDLVHRLADRLMSSFVENAGVFPHSPDGDATAWWRSHVACYADLVYPIQALSWYHQATSSERALAVARRCAERMCERQGPEGQWWWHYDVRTGNVVEHYPVYAVHQDAMGPMCLFACQEAGGGDFREAIRRSVAWFDASPELEGSLIDETADVIWRKVARHEPGKLVRGLQAAASRVHPSCRAPAVNTLFRPGRIDFETRPYHMGWILHAFTAGRTRTLRATADATAVQVAD